MFQPAKLDEIYFQVGTPNEQTTQEEDSRDFTAAMMPSDYYVIIRGIGWKLPSVAGTSRYLKF